MSNPTVLALIKAINAGDREAFFGLLTPDATMSDDGSERDLPSWVDKEIFDADGRMKVESQSGEGLTLVAEFTNATWGAMRTKWRFTLSPDGKVSRFETGQA